MRPIGDAILGRRWDGPSLESDALTLTLDDLERRWEETGEEAPERDLSSDAAVAYRYAPVLYQRVMRGKYDLLRRMDFDGDWDTLNNWEHTSDDSDRSAWVYYDVRETDSHYYVSYVLYHSGRHSKAIKPRKKVPKEPSHTVARKPGQKKRATLGSES